MASSSFDRSFERVWESLPLPEQVTLPWDKDHWNTVFGVELQSMTNPVVSFRRPIVPAPSHIGQPSKRPITSSEMQVWAKTLLTHHDLDISGKRLTSHSCKRTTLAWCSMFGISWQDRLILGGHSMGMRSAITYSRDVVARPLPQLEQVLEAVRDERFKPDETRSGRFVKRVPDMEQVVQLVLQKIAQRLLTRKRMNTHR